jgi:hypothetical protein
MAGVIHDFDWNLAWYHIGGGKHPSPADCLLAMNGNVIQLPDGKLFVPKFITFQYGHLSDISKVHIAVRGILNRLSIPYPYPIDRIQDKDKDKDKDQGGSVRGGATGPQDDESAWLATLKAEYAKVGVDVDRALVDARAWLTSPKGRGRKFTRQFFVNWLKRCDRNVTATAPVDQDKLRARYIRECVDALWTYKDDDEQFPRTLSALNDKYRDIPKDKNGETVVDNALEIIKLRRKGLR